MIKAPEHIKNIKPYVPGKPIEELERELGITGSIKLASNESPIGPSPLAVKALADGIHGLNRYPDGSCYSLKNALSQKLGIASEEIIFGNGSNEIIELAVRTFLSPGDEAIMASPSFVVYPTVTQAAGGKSIVVPLKDFRHDLEAMASAITAKTKVIFIANPNNPTGTINSRAEMDAFMEKVPDDVLVVIDEAYFEYVSSTDYPDSMEYLKKGRPVLILRTFSKIYGLAGLRIGYGLAHSSIISEMNKVRQPFNINSLAQIAALAALEDAEHVERAKKTNEDGKEFLYKELRSMGVDYLPTEANFIYIILKHDTALQLYNELLKKGVIIRPMGKRELRVTIGLADENKRFIKALQAVMKQ
ncbi:MAG: histidinol-phosphate transaminase [Thermodesulfovibrionia bacterium]|nr:histidinol-phosphate transaminase [Thermodesulfovibrionia bacterium]